MIRFVHEHSERIRAGAWSLAWRAPAFCCSASADPTRSTRSARSCATSWAASRPTSSSSASAAATSPSAARRRCPRSPDRSPRGSRRGSAGRGHARAGRVGMRYWHPFIADARRRAQGARLRPGHHASRSRRSSPRSPPARTARRSTRRSPSTRRLEIVEAPLVSELPEFVDFFAASDRGCARRTRAERGRDRRVHGAQPARVRPRRGRPVRRRARARRAGGRRAARAWTPASTVPASSMLAGFAAFGVDRARRVRGSSCTSRKGERPGAWLGPDLDDADRRVRPSPECPALVVCPIGFMTDHMETLYDLDIVAAERGARRRISSSCAPRCPTTIRRILDALAESVRDARSSAATRVPGRTRQPRPYRLTSEEHAREARHHHRRRSRRTRRRLQDPPRGRRRARRRVRARREGRPPRREARHRARRGPGRRAATFVVDGGSDSFLTDKPAVHRVAKLLGIFDDETGTLDENKKTFIVKDGKLVEMPDGIMMFAPTKIMPMATTKLYSWPAKFRMALDLVIPEEEGRRRASATTRSLESFVVRRMGRECLDRLAEPLVGGVNGSDPKEMSLAATYPMLLEMEQKHGSLVQGLPRPAQEGRGDEEEVPAQARARSGARSSARFMRGTAVPHRPHGRRRRARDTSAPARPPRRSSARTTAAWSVTLDTGEALDRRRVIVATEAWATAPLVRGVDARIAELVGVDPVLVVGDDPHGLRRGGLPVRQELARHPVAGGRARAGHRRLAHVVEVAGPRAGGHACCCAGSSADRATRRSSSAATRSSSRSLAARSSSCSA